MRHKLAAARCVVCWLVCFVSVASVAAAAPPPVPTTRSGDEQKYVGDMYYLDTCAACPSKLGSKGETVLRYYDLRSVRFCQESCAAQFERDLRAGFARLNDILGRDQLPYYPLADSLVSGKPLGDKPVDYFWGNRLVRLAGDAEVSQFLARPEHYIALLDNACIQRQLSTYSFSKCPVQGDILISDDVELLVVANRMVRVCCHRCVTSVRSRPVQYLAMVDYANRRAAAEKAAARSP